MIVDEEEGKDLLFNGSLEKGLMVLGAFKGERRHMSIREVAEVVGLNRSSAQRMVYTLEKLGFIRKSEKTRKYQLTLKALNIGFNYMASNPIVDLAGPFLLELSNVTGETTNLTEPDGTEMVYVSRYIAPKFIPVQMHIGSRIPAYCTGSGRAYLSALPWEEAASIIERSDLVRHTEWTECDIDRLRDIILETKRRGFAYNKEEFYLGDMTVGAAVMGARGRPIGAVHVVAPTSRWSLEAACERLGPAVIECANGISRSIRAVD